MRIASTCLFILGLFAVVYAAERQRFPEDFPGPPFYVGAVDSPDDGWTAVVFFRDPDCIPEDANLLQNSVAARSCALVTHGWIERSLPPPGPPDVFHAEGNKGMPVWILSSDDRADAVADGVLTIGELEDIPSLLKGTAKKFVNHQDLRDGLDETIKSHGGLEDGRRFKVKVKIKDDVVKKLSVRVIDDDDDEEEDDD